jgi:hypothetical protein
LTETDTHNRKLVIIAPPAPPLDAKDLTPHGSSI